MFIHYPRTCACMLALLDQAPRDLNNAVMAQGMHAESDGFSDLQQAASFLPPRKPRWLLHSSQERRSSISDCPLEPIQWQRMRVREDRRMEVTIKRLLAKGTTDALWVDSLRSSMKRRPRKVPKLHGRWLGHKTQDFEAVCPARLAVKEAEEVREVQNSEEIRAGLEVLSQHPDHAAREAREPAGMHDVQAELHLDMEEGGLGMPGWTQPSSQKLGDWLNSLFDDCGTAGRSIAEGEKAEAEQVATSDSRAGSERAGERSESHSAGNGRADAASNAESETERDDERAEKSEEWRKPDPNVPEPGPAPAADELLHSLQTVVPVSTTGSRGSRSSNVASEVPTDLTLRSVDAQQIAEAVTTDVALQSMSCCGSTKDLDQTDDGILEDSPSISSLTAAGHAKELLAELSSRLEAEAADAKDAKLQVHLNLWSSQIDAGHM
ncbi:unnamed protein product [Durusdinium trenchii]|uniref:Uncharacterized protein n=1 Tax=Durusdinium trenchii TaxID=1381693 RepID=A0ABP0KQG9_9DINO